MYYKLYFRDVSGELADVLEVTLTDGSDVLYTGTLSGLTRSTAATAPAVLAVGQAGPCKRRSTARKTPATPPSRPA